MTLELVIIGVTLMVSVTALVMSNRHPQANYENVLTQVRDMEKIIADLRTRVTEAEKHIETLVRENVRLQAIIYWQQVQFEKHNIKLGPLPEYLKDSQGFSGLSINFTDSGIEINGSDVTANNIVGGNQSSN